jgi:hypothetical protein
MVWITSNPLGDKMHVIKWIGLYGHIVVRKYKTEEEANAMKKWLRREGIGFAHTFEEE